MSSNNLDMLAEAQAKYVKLNKATTHAKKIQREMQQQANNLANQDVMFFDQFGGKEQDEIQNQLKNEKIDKNQMQEALTRL